MPGLLEVLAQFTVLLLQTLDCALMLLFAVDQLVVHQFDSSFRHSRLVGQLA